MMESDLLKYIRDEIRKQVHIVLSGEAGTNTVESEDIQNLLPGMATLVQRPVMHPYGFASRAPAKTIQVTARQGEHPANRLVLGHRAADRPQDLEPGECAVYSLGKFTLRMKNDKLELGKDGVFEEMVMGQTLKEFLVALVDAILVHTHLGNLGFPTSVPLNSATFTTLKDNNLTNEKILSKDGGRF